MIEVKVKSGRLKGKTFKLEAEISEMPGGETSLAMLASQGNYAAANALDIDNYTIADRPFYYGHIDGLGYIIALKDLDYSPKK